LHLNLHGGGGYGLKRINYFSYYLKLDFLSGGKLNTSDKIVITGAAGLLGQNTILLLKKRGYKNIIAIDKHEENLDTLKKINPEITVVLADLAQNKNWQEYFNDAKVLLLMHAQITSKNLSEFQRNNEYATKNVLDIAKKYNIQFIVHISSSVVVSKANDFYTNTKKAQDKLVEKSNIPFITLRPSLMFGLFDKKHIGWLSRFMGKTPIFPIPGNGEYMRQPLYASDMAKVVISAMEKSESGKYYNIIGKEDITYINIIRAVKKEKKLKTLIIKLPYWLFKFLLDFYGVFSKNPPFTSQQLEALTAGDYFENSNWEKIFEVKATPFAKALRETFNDERYSKIVLHP
jgi:nucleoside-diphosphate-sugar epimerase